MRLCDWCRNTKVSLYPSKTSFIIFPSHHRVITSIYYLRLGTHFIYTNDHTTFSGLVLDKHLKFHLHIKPFIAKIAFDIHLVIKTRAYFPVTVLRSFCICFVHSHISYCLGSGGSTFMFIYHRLFLCKTKPSVSQFQLSNRLCSTFIY